MILIECYVDEFLLRCLNFSKRRIKHCRGKGNVIKLLMDDYGDIGVVDEDPGSSQPKAISRFVEQSQTQNLRLCQHANKILIIINENIESWIVKRAVANRINMNIYRLTYSDILNKTPHIERNPNFQRFIHDLTELDDEMSSLKDWIIQYS